MNKIVSLIILCLSINICAAETAKGEVKTDAKVEQNYNLPIIGKVLEKIDASSYSYLRIKTQTEEVWVAVPQLEIALNTEVEMTKPIPMFGFESKTLKRKFDRIFFGMLKSQKEEMAKERAKNAKK